MNVDMTKLLRIRNVSDLHLEHYYDTYDASCERAKEHLSTLIPPHQSDKKTVLIVAGDLATARRAGRIVTFMSMVVPRFMHVIYVLGNHEHYGSVIDESEKIIRDALESNGIDMSKMTIAGNNVATVEIKGITFHATTMWTDYDHGNPMTAMTIERYITDHRTILNSRGGVFRPNEGAYLHSKIRQQLIDKLSEKNDNSKTIVVTHHMPSYSTIDPMYRQSEPAITLNAAFAAHMDDVIEKYQPAYWFFGHTHTKYVGQIGSTQLRCNPLGYPNESNTVRGVFDPLFSVSIAIE